MCLIGGRERNGMHGSDGRTDGQVGKETEGREGHFPPQLPGDLREDGGQPPATHRQEVIV